MLRESVRVPGWAVAAVAVLQGLAVVSTLSASSAHLALDVVAAVAGVTLVPLLPRRPVAVGTALGLLALLSPAATPTATCGAFVVAQLRPFRAAAVVAAVGAAAHVVRGVWRPATDLPLGWWALFVVVAYATLVGWGAYVQARRALLASLRERAERAESEQARRAAEARTLERTRIAREMHDVLAHRLSLLATYAGALEYRPDAPPERLAAAAGVVRKGVHEALEELREVIGVLRSDEPAADGGAGPGRPQPTLDRLPHLVEENRAAGMTVELRCGVDPAVVPAPLGRTAYRVAQEALTNARRHAPGQPVDVSVAGAPGSTLDVEVRNRVEPAATPPPSPGAGAGLIGLRERVELAGGALEHGRAQGEFRLTARLPWAT